MGGRKLSIGSKEENYKENYYELKTVCGYPRESVTLEQILQLHSSL